MDRKIKLKMGKESYEILPDNTLMEDLDAYIKTKAEDIQDFLSNQKIITDVTVHMDVVSKALDFGGVEYSRNDLYEAFCEAELADILMVTQEILTKVFPFYFPKPKKKTSTSSRKRKDR